MASRSMGRTITCYPEKKTAAKAKKSLLLLRETDVGFSGVSFSWIAGLRTGVPGGAIRQSR